MGDDAGSKWQLSIPRLEIFRPARPNASALGGGGEKFPAHSRGVLSYGRSLWLQRHSTAPETTVFVLEYGCQCDWVVVAMRSEEQQRNNLQIRRSRCANKGQNLSEAWRGQIARRRSAAWGRLRI